MLNTAVRLSRVRVCCSFPRPFLSYSGRTPVTKKSVTTSSMTSAIDLAKASCHGACSKETPLVTREEMDKLLPEVPAWHVDASGKALSRRFTARNFKAAMDYLNKVAEVAEQEGHHPDLHLTNFRDVEVVVSSHAAGGLTVFDFVLASKLDKLEVDYSPKWAREHGLAA